MFLGDSITAGGDWNAWFPDISISELSVPGDSLEQILYRIDMIRMLNPQKVFLLAGVNNISRSHYDNTIRNTYSLILQKLNTMACEVYVQSILPVREPSKVDNNRISQANEIIKKLAMEYGCEYIDLHNAFTDTNGEMKKGLTTDGVHLNEYGYAVWREQIRDYIRVI